MSRTIEIAEDQRVEEQTVSWGEVMLAIGYPGSWGKVVSASLEANGKALVWAKVPRQENG